MSIQPFTTKVDWPEIECWMGVSIMFNICRYCVFTWYSSIVRLHMWVIDTQIRVLQWIECSYRFLQGISIIGSTEHSGCRWTHVVGHNFLYAFCKHFQCYTKSVWQLRNIRWIHVKDLPRDCRTNYYNDVVGGISGDWGVQFFINPVRRVPCVCFFP